MMIAFDAGNDSVREGADMKHLCLWTIVLLLAASLAGIPSASADEVSGKGTWGLMAQPVSITIDFGAGTFRGEFSDESSMGITSTSVLKGTLSGAYRGSKAEGALEGFADYTETRVSKGIGPTGRLAVDQTTESKRLTFRGALKGGVVTGRCFEGETPSFGPFTISLGGAAPAERPAAGEEVAPEKIAKLGDCFQKSVQEKIQKGYFVKNDGWFRGLKHTVQDQTPWAEVGKAGRCGEYGERGMAWIRDCVKNLFGDKALVTDIVIEEESTAAPEGKPGALAYWNPDRIYESNHRATRVVLPDGERYVVDYWEGVSTGKPQMISEEEWIKKWREKIGRMDYRINRDTAEKNLKDLIKEMGEEKGIKAFRAVSKKNGMPDERIELWIRCWERKPWRVD